MKNGYARIVISLVLLVLLPACRPSTETSRGVAEAFLDAQYVEIDLDGARELASGLARRKIEEEIALTSEVEIDAETRRPHISYSLQSAREAPSQAQYDYQLTIRAPGLEPFHRIVMVTVRDGDEGWTVTNYAESEPAVPSR
jgi:hypothetical protein